MDSPSLLNSTNQTALLLESLWPSIHVYWALVLTAGIYLALLALITVFANGFLLLTIYKNSTPYFRKPVTVLITALAIADFVNGLIIDPLHSFVFLARYFKSMTSETYVRLSEASMLLGVVTMNASYLIILVLSCSQVIAIAFPYRHRTIITTRSVSIAVAFISLYCVLFALSYMMGVPKTIFQKIEVFWHMTGLTAVLMATYVCLQICYSRQRKKLRRLMTSGRIKQSRIHHKAKSVAGHRKFIKVNLLLIACLLVSTLPVIVVWYVWMFATKPRTLSQIILEMNIGIIVDNFLYLKFLLDPIIYAWRMPRYRRALRHTLRTACTNTRCCTALPVAASTYTANTNTSVGTIYLVAIRDLAQDDPQVKTNTITS